MSNNINISNSTLIGTNTVGHGAAAVTNIVHGNIDQAAFESLARALSKSGVSGDDIQLLRSAITADASSQDVSAKKFGPAVRGWMKGMIGKVLDASWQIEIGVASNLLTAAISKYYGWP